MSVWPNTPYRLFSSALPLLVLAVLMCACEGESDQTRQCPETACEQGLLCLQQRCVAENSDPDNDGLSSARELAAGLDPLSPDSDADGLSDGAEWGNGETPSDLDGDGVPDALESQDKDGDGDCVPDVWDANSQLATQPPAGWVEQLCARKGVCAQEGALLELVCSGGVANCLVKNSDAFQSAESLCDGLDNDCDGIVDEGIWWGVAALGGTCWGLGACGTGRVECDSSTRTPICSTMPGGSASQATPEVCDGIDNNCDGSVDEGQFYDGIPVGQPCEGTGACGEGVVACSGDRLPICSTMPGGPQSQAKEETCDGKDNDCDGYVDEDVVPPSVKECPSLGVCAVPWSAPTLACVEGAWKCVFAGVESYEPDFERTCDNLDNDCDGHVDEDFALAGPAGAIYLGQPCGVGPCNGGVAICAADGNGAVCSTHANATPEVCDGADNDCDGVSDNGLTYQGRIVGEPCTGVGACGQGVVVCSASKEINCSSNPGMPDSGASAELCDWVDNDCDGEVDEGLGPGLSCASVGVCASATFPAVCAQGFWRCEYSALPGYQAEELACDGQDNDCDGRKDEGTDATFLAATAGVTSDAPPHLAGASVVLVGDDLWQLGGEGRTLEGELVCPQSWWRQQKDGTWTAAADAAWAGRSLAAAVTRPQGDAAVLLGGRCGSQLRDDAWQVSATASSLLPLPQPVTARYGHVLFSETETGQLIVVGGQDAVGAFADSYACGPNYQCVGPLPGFPLLTQASYCQDALANRGYLFGGRKPDGTLSNQLYVLDLPSLKVVSLEHSFGPTPSLGAAMFCKGDSVWVAGGEDESGELLADVWAYSLANQSWATKPPLPTGRVGGLLSEQSSGMVLRGAIDGQGRLDRSAGLVLTFQGAWQPLGSRTPSVGVGAAVATDPFSQVVCVTGGEESAIHGPAVSDVVWCSSGTNWEEAGRLQAALVDGVFVYDPYEDRYLALGGVVDQTSLCRAEWVRPWEGQGGLLPWCQDGTLPALPAGTRGVVDAMGLVLYLLIPAQSGPSPDGWMLDLATLSLSSLVLPGEFAGMTVSQLLFDDSSGLLWAFASVSGMYRLVAWIPGSGDAVVDTWLESLPEPAGAWADADSGQVLALGPTPAGALLVMPADPATQPAPPSAPVPAQLQGAWAPGQWLVYWSEPESRDQMALGRVDQDSLTRPSTLRVQMRCK